LRLQLDGVRHRKKLANHVTGGFGTDEMTWFQEEAQLFVGDVGVHTIRLETKGFFPHVSGLLFSPVDPNAPAPEPEKERVVMDPTSIPVRARKSWADRTWGDLPLGNDVVRVDGPGTDHDELIMLTKIDSLNFVCTFELELELDAQPDHQNRCGRHGGIGIGQKDMELNNRNPGDGIWLGWWPGGVLNGALNGSWGTDDKPLPWTARPELTEKPTKWVVKVNEHESGGSVVTIHIDEALVIDAYITDENRTLDGNLCFWRALSAHNLVVRDLRVVTTPEECV